MGQYRYDIVSFKMFDQYKGSEYKRYTDGIVYSNGFRWTYSVFIVIQLEILLPY